MFLIDISAMRNHLKVHNKSNPNEKDSDDVTVAEPALKKFKSLKQPDLKLFVKKESLGELLAKCAAKDGFSINAITNSSAIKELIQKRGYQMPRSTTTTTVLIMQFFEVKRKKLKTQLISEIKNGAKYSITVDEWTDINIKRFLNVTLHGNGVAHNLGLIKIIGSCDAVATQNLVEAKLLEFGIALSDIVCSTHDGAAVMQRYERLTVYVNINKQQLAVKSKSSRNGVDRFLVHKYA